jgi:sugar transferase (PEP-CTERM/EpsH1 system associated)
MLNRPLRVAHVVLALDVGGLERNVVNQVREGRALGQEVTVVCLERPGALAPKVEAHGGKLRCLDKPPGIRIRKVAEMRRLFRELRPDVVHSHQIGTLIYAGPAAQGAGVPLVVHTEHGREDYGGRRRTRLLGRLAGRFARVFYCLTDDMAAHVTSHGIVPCRKVRVILNGIDTAQFRGPHDRAAVRLSLGIPAAATVVGTVGRLVEVKRQDVLIRAFAAMEARIPGVRLLLVGDGPLRDELRALAAGLGLADRVHFAGYQPDSAPYLHAMDIFALTSRSEGMPQSLLEAAVAGRPVIASRVGGIPEVVSHGRSGLLVEPGDEGALADGLLRLAADRSLADRLAAEARLRVESMFHVRRMAGDYHRDFLAMLRIGPPGCREAQVASAPGVAPSPAGARNPTQLAN